jgi:hypothetical protein
LIFLKKWFTGFYTGLPVIPTGFGGFQPLSADRFTDFGIGLPIIPIGKSVIPTGLLILDSSNAKFEFGAVFDRFYEFSW